MIGKGHRANHMELQQDVVKLQREVGFIELLKNNSTFRRLWIGLAISLLGEWFSTVALFVLIYTLTGSELGIGLLFVIRMFSMAFPQIFTGMLADRFSRKRIMVWANILSSIAVLSLLMVDDESEVWLIYFISALLMALHAVFIPAESASIPNITKENELLTDVSADKEKIEQVLTNLIENSIKYGKENGTTEIVVQNLNENKIIVRVTDNGVGFEKENYTRIFERFFRIDKSGNRSSGGSGLGLSIVKHVIDVHDEKIYVESELGVGSEFSFSLEKSK